MKYKTLFRILLKVIAVWLVANTLVEFVQASVRWLDPISRGYFASVNFLVWLGGHGAAIAIGLYLFFGGRLIADLAIPSNRPYCHHCGYELSNVRGAICPECGTRFRGEDEHDDDRRADAPAATHD